jgi:hypothetical protein
VVRHSRLGDFAAGSEVAGTDGPLVGELAKDAEPGGIGGTLQQEEIGVDGSLHPLTISMALDIDKCQYMGDDPPVRRNTLNRHDNQAIVTMLIEERLREAETARLVSALRAARPRRNLSVRPAWDQLRSLFADRRNEATCAC